MLVYGTVCFVFFVWSETCGTISYCRIPAYSTDCGTVCRFFDVKIDSKSIVSAFSESSLELLEAAKDSMADTCEFFARTRLYFFADDWFWTGTG